MTGRRIDGFNFTHGFHIHQQLKIIGEYNELTILISCFLKSLILITYQLSDLCCIFKNELHLDSESEMLEMGSSWVKSGNSLYTAHRLSYPTI